MPTQVRCKCGWTKEVPSTGSVKCPVCGHVIYALDTDWRRELAEDDLYEEVTLWTTLRDWGRDAWDLFYQFVLLHPFRVISATIILGLICWIGFVLIRANTQPNPLQEDYELAIQLIQQNKRKMARTLLHSIIERSPTSAVARRAREQLTLLGEDLTVGRTPRVQAAFDEGERPGGARPPDR